MNKIIELDALPDKKVLAPLGKYDVRLNNFTTDGDCPYLIYQVACHQRKPDYLSDFRRIIISAAQNDSLSLNFHNRKK